MFTHLRYALAAVLLTASVGCIALWEWSVAHANQINLLSYSQVAGYSRSYRCLVFHSGEAFVSLKTDSVHWTDWSGWRFQSSTSSVALNLPGGRFGASDGGFHFPLWYPALIFALAGVGALRFRRQFSIRSALIATTVVAALIGMAVIL